MFLPTLNKVMNAYLALDPDSEKRLSKLQGKVIAIELKPLNITFQCAFTANDVNLMMDDTLIPNTTIRGTPIQMLSMMITKNNRQQFFADDVVIEGDAELGQQVIQLFDDMQIDWEEHLSQLFGDATAHHTGRLVEKTSSWLKDTIDSFSQNINEYLQEEAAWLPSREALQDLFQDIDTLRMDIDRLEARVKQAATRREAK